MVCPGRGRLKVASVVAISAFLVLLVLPAVDLPETNFDEANTPTNEMVVQEPFACSVCMASLKTVVPRISVHTRQTRGSNTSLVSPTELSYSPCSPPLSRMLRC